MSELDARSEGETLVQRYHERFAGATALTFASARDAAGRSSYERIVDDVERVRARTVLDLACGDGYLLERLRSPVRTLAGIDVSASELAAAQRRLGDAAELVRARADALPFPDETFDAVVSHLALMLMEGLDRVLAEVARVLRGGGMLSAVVGASGSSAAALDAFRATWRATVERTGHVVPPIGDPRAQDGSCFAEALAAAGFDDLVLDDFTVSRHASAHEIATYYGLYYPPASLPDDERARFVEELTAALVERERAGEELAFVSAMTHVRARRAA